MRLDSVMALASSSDMRASAPSASSGAPVRMGPHVYTLA